MAYTVSYNPENNNPNWGAWNQEPTDLVERVGRSNKFLPNPCLDSSIAVTTDEYKACVWDYTNKGICPPIRGKVFNMLVTFPFIAKEIESEENNW